MAPKFAQIHKQQNQEKEREGGGGGEKIQNDEIWNPTEPEKR
jgi:hypothetical protein